ncbi:MAG TPA: NfeD family protein [Thermoanaerobaculia bacterium]|nr:NfeD family protein [Thermoanaerobaculia bacterium]
MTMVYIWLALAVFSIGIEVVSAHFGSIFIALGALVAAVVAAIGLGLPFQAVAFVASAFLSLAVLRPTLVSKMRSRGVPSRTEVLVGKRGVITDAIDPDLGSGRLTVAGEDWAARASRPLPVGTPVRVEWADGIVLHVEPIEMIDGPNDRDKEIM